MRREEMKPHLANKILSQKLIKPATPTPHNLRKLSISSLDQIQPPAYVSYIFFYPISDKDEAAKNADRSKQLQKSLSEILTLFYPLAGRYIQDSFFIDCNDYGAEYLEANVASRLNSFLNKDIDNNELLHFIPQQSESSASPLVAVQCNMFECGGLAIGLCISHRIVDASVYTKFIDGWATACRVGIDKVRRPSFDMASLLPPREMKPVPPLTPRLNTAMRTFVFSGLAISNLREIAKVGGVKDSTKVGNQPSRVQLVTALIWKALIGVAQAKHGKLRPSAISHLINMRRRTVLPMSDDCCGNHIRPVVVRFTPDMNSTKVGYHELVNLVCDAIENAVTDCAKPQNADEVFMMVDMAWKEYSSEPAKEYNIRDEDKIQTYFFTSTCRMPFYPDFGWGKPTRVCRVQTLSEIIIVMMDTTDGEGIEAFICLDENEMSLFQQDPDIINFSSQFQHHKNQSTHLRSRF